MDHQQMDLGYGAYTERFGDDVLPATAPAPPQAAPARNRRPSSDDAPPMRDDGHGTPDADGPPAGPAGG